MANAAQTELLNLLRTAGPITWVIPKSELGGRKKGESHKKLVELLKYARAELRLSELEGRVVLLFQGFDGDPREVFEIEECRKWLLRVEKEVGYFFLVLEPRVALPILMFCYVPFEKVGTTVLPDEDKAIGFLLDCAYVTYQVARIDERDAPKEVAAAFLTRAGLGQVVNVDLLSDFERTYDAEESE